LRSLIEERVSEEDAVPMRVCVTGGAGGLGAAVVSCFLHRDAWVHIADVSAEGIARSLAENPGIHATVADLTSPQEVTTMVAEAREWMGGVDVLVNCAQLVVERYPVDQTSWEEWNRLMTVNAGGAFAAIQNVVPLMKKQRGGCIVNLLSSAVKTGLPKRAAYVASQAAILGLTQTLARELGPHGIRCNAVIPGMVQDAATAEMLRLVASEHRVSADEAEGELLKYVSMRSWTEPDLVAETVAFLASAEARLITGQTLGVSGNVEWES